jgi:CheY-like chemotaxis protein
MESASAQSPFDRPGHAHAPKADAQRQAAVCNVLIVDANEISSLVLTTTLEAAGYGAATAINLDAAEKTLLNSRPDLILQSLSVSGLNYRQMAARFRRIAAIPIVGYACVLPPETRGDEKLGFAGFLTKPFAPAHLVRALPFYLWNKACPRPPEATTSSTVDRDTISLRATLPDPGIEQGNVLVVEDNLFQRERLGEALTNVGFSVTLARHGIEALEKLGRFKPDLIVSDTLMTGCDGFELCLAVRRFARTKDLPLLITPPNPCDALDETVAHALGADAYLSRAGGLDRVVDGARVLIGMSRRSSQRPIGASI